MTAGDPSQRYDARDRTTRRTITPELAEYNAEYARWQREWAAWQAKRIAVTAENFGIPVAKVQLIDIGICRGLYGVPEGPETEPKMRRDRRYGPRRPWKGGRRPPGVRDD